MQDPSTSTFVKGQKSECHLVHSHLQQEPMLVEPQLSCLLTTYLNYLEHHKNASKPTAIYESAVTTSVQIRMANIRLINSYELHTVQMLQNLPKTLYPTITRSVKSVAQPHWAPVILELQNLDSFLKFQSYPNI